MRFKVVGLFFMLVASLSQANSLFGQEQSSEISQSLQVQVVDHEGQGVADVRVLPWAGAYLGAEGTTDQSGFVSLESLSGYGGLAIVAPDRIAEFVPLSFGADVITVVLQKAHTITGQVLFPVKHATARPKELSLFGPSEDELPSLPFSVSVALDELEIYQGGCDLTLDEEGRFQVHGIYEGWQSTTFLYPHGQVEVVEGEVEIDSFWGEFVVTSDTEHLVLDYFAMPEITGRIVMEGAQWQAEDVFLDIEFECEGLEEPLTATVFNDVDGSIQSSLNLPEGELRQAWYDGTLDLKLNRISANLETYYRSSGIPIEIDVSDRESLFELGDILLEPFESFDVRVLDQQGAPIAHAAIDADALGDLGDENGFVLVLPGEEPTELIVGAPGYKTATFPWPSDTEEVVEVVLEKDTKLNIVWQLPKETDLDDLSLMIRNPEGETVIRGELQLLREARIRIGYDISWKYERDPANAEDQSVFEYWISSGVDEVIIWGLESGVPLEISLAGSLGNQIFKPQTITLKPQEHRTVEMEVNFVPRVLRGTVVDKDGAPIVEGEIYFGGLEGDYESGYISQTGDFEITGLATETINLAIVADGFEDVVMRNLTINADGSPIQIAMDSAE